MGRKIVLGTWNRHKVEELGRILGEAGFLVEGLSGGVGEPEEGGETFRENAREKALYFSRFVDGWVLSEDSGLEVEALGGEPGVYSKRYGGGAGDAVVNNWKLLERLEGVPWFRRRAQFVCCVCLACGGKVLFEGEGVVRGYIGWRPEGEGGFGYDPLFYYPPLGRTFAQMGEGKWRVSHRFLALRTFLEWWDWEGRGL